MRTVETHVSPLLRKLEVPARGQDRLALAVAGEAEPGTVGRRAAAPVRSIGGSNV
ncbi:hypothetical protein Pen02_28030 [Plantactinospora endophytica]|uniref:HTH luxR-type domain-containing protein n=1 Tax=Plantactinospora endophytica TaxID=673535 RepID=A0ABQ4DZL5_9ACTN|nr:hypothetical protein Pen02_28030 [Plantactinospora endophytica]